MLGCILMISSGQDVAIVKHLNQVRELTVSIKTSISFLNLCGWAGGFCRKVCKSVLLMKDGESFFFFFLKSSSKVHGGGTSKWRFPSSQ